MIIKEVSSSSLIRPSRHFCHSYIVFCINHCSFLFNLFHALIYMCIFACVECTQLWSVPQKEEGSDCRLQEEAERCWERWYDGTNIQSWQHGQTTYSCCQGTNTTLSTPFGKYSLHGLLFFFKWMFQKEKQLCHLCVHVLGCDCQITELHWSLSRT